MNDNRGYLEDVIEQFTFHSNSENAANMKKYMKNKFEFFGIKSPLRKEITKTYLKKNNLPPIDFLNEIVKGLWEEDNRELQYFGVDLTEKLLKQMSDSALELFEYMIINKSWWDTVDGIAINIAGPYFKTYAQLIDPVTKKWMNSDNIWLQRTSILFQLKYKQDTDTRLLFRYIKQLAGSKEFFIRKSIGWALREYSKTNPKAVIKFVENNKLSALSRKEALRLVK